MTEPVMVGVHLSNGTELRTVLEVEEDTTSEALHDQLTTAFASASARKVPFKLGSLTLYPAAVCGIEIL